MNTSVCLDCFLTLSAKPYRLELGSIVTEIDETTTLLKELLSV